jgi:hypothetical protein
MILKFQSKLSGNISKVTNMNIIFLDVDGVLNGAKDFGYERSPDTIDCYVDTEKGKQHFGRVNKHQLDKLREIVKLADAKVYLISSWSVAFKIEEMQNAQETFNEFFSFEVIEPEHVCLTANGRAQFAIDLLKSEDYDAAVYLDDMQDFDPEILQELQSKCFVPVIKGSVGLRDGDFEAIKEYFAVREIN